MNTMPCGSESVLGWMMTWSMRRLTSSRAAAEPAHLRQQSLCLGRLQKQACEYEAVFNFDLADVVARISARTLALEFTTPEEAHLGERGPRLSALMPNATAASIPVNFLAALERQSPAIADTAQHFLKDGK